MKYRLVTTLQSEPHAPVIVTKDIELSFHPTAETRFVYPLWNDVSRTPVITARIDDSGRSSAKVDELELHFTDDLPPVVDLQPFVQLYLDRGWSLA